MKSLSIVVVVLLLLSSMAAIGLSKKADVETFSIKQSTTIEKTFLIPSTNEKQIQDISYTELSMEGTEGYLYTAGKPILPISKTNFDLGFGSKIIDVECTVENIKTKTVENKIIPAPKPVISNMENAKAEYEMDTEIYDSNKYYPDNWYTITTGAGLDENLEHKTFVNIRINPVRYNPTLNEIKYTNDIKIKITYEEPKTNPFPTNANYDMVIIAPSAFSSELQRLITHKNKYEIETYLKTTEEIYSQYSGVDKPEKIKYFIKDALETEGIKYVLLVGGMTSLISGESRDDENQGSADWHVPVRYTNCKEMGSVYDPGFISDLYYADIYDSEGGFCSWDEDNNGNSDGIFAQWGKSFTLRKDILDLYPDVIVGRLACRTLSEVKGVVTKIIDYERLKHESDWYDNLVLIGGDSHDDSEDILEGEVACDYVAENYMEEFNPIKLYSSHGKDQNSANDKYIPSPDAIQTEVTTGCGHLLFEGHGHPGSWNTHWPGEFNWEDTPGGIDVAQFNGLKNEIKLPVCVIGGCHNAQFNVTLMATTLNKPFMWTHGTPVAESFAWHLVRLTSGGTIASFGNTGLGYGAVGDNGDIDGDGINQPDTLEAVGGYQIRMFYKTFDEGADILGDVWLGTQNKYLDTWPGMEDQTDCKTVEQWPILGDPSLKIGGYKTDEKSKSKDIQRMSILEYLLDLPILQRMLRLPVVQRVLEL